MNFTKPLLELKIVILHCNIVIYKYITTCTMQYGRCSLFMAEQFLFLCHLVTYEEVCHWQSYKIEELNEFPGNEY